MCGRTSLAVAAAALEERFDARVADGVTVEPRYNIAPRDDLLAVRNDDSETISTLNWGFLPHWANSPDDGPRPINARSETAAEKPLFREAFRERRCLLLADGFYEWQGSRGHKQPYRIERVDREPFAFAGLWDRWTGPDGADRFSCTVLTTDANDAVASVHDRMPVMLEPGEEAAWLGGADLDAWQSLLDAYPDDLLRVYPVSTRVNSPRHDGPDLLEEIDIGTQSGLGDFAG